MKNLFFGLLVLSLFSFTTSEDIGYAVEDCPEGTTEVTLSCTLPFCAKFPSSFTAQDQLDWVLAAENGTCGGSSAPSESIDPAS